MKRAVPTRWNSLAEAIGRALELRGGIDALVRLGKYDKTAKAGGLKHLRLDKREWDILKQLHEVLKVRYPALLPFDTLANMISDLPSCNRARVED